MVKGVTKLILLILISFVFLMACSIEKKKLERLIAEADVLVEMNKYDEAIEKYKEIMGIDNNDNNGYRLNQIKSMKKQWDKEQEVERIRKEEAERVDRLLNEIPEPYTRALNNIKNGSYEWGLKYLDLTISDFPNNKYVYSAFVLKGILLSADYEANKQTYLAMMDGGDVGESLISEDERTKLENMKKIYLDNLESISVKLRDISVYLLNHYSTERFHVNNAGWYMDQVDPVESSDLDHFIKVGYPVPKESVFRDYYTHSFY